MRTGALAVAKVRQAGQRTGRDAKVVVGIVRAERAIAAAPSAANPLIRRLRIAPRRGIESALRYDEGIGLGASDARQVPPGVGVCPITSDANNVARGRSRAFR